LSERQLKALGKSGPDQAPPDNSYEGTDPRTGQPEIRYPGIDRGWEYNPGRDWLEGVVPTEMRTPAAVASRAPADRPVLPKPRASKAEVLPASLSAEAYVNRFLDAFGVKPDSAGYYRDASGGIVTISRDLFSQAGAIPSFSAGRYALMIAAAIQDPDEIWAAWALPGNASPLLQRTYLRRFNMGKDGNLLVQFVWTKNGWRAVASFTATDAEIEVLRVGALLYSQAAGQS
jgi:hypothetical protein